MMFVFYVFLPVFHRIVSYRVLSIFQGQGGRRRCSTCVSATKQVIFTARIVCMYEGGEGTCGWNFVGGSRVRGD